MLKYSYKNEDDIPAEYRDLYIEVNGQFLLQVEGVKTPDDVARVQEGLRKEREDHKVTKKALADYRNLAEDPLELQERLDRAAELELLGDGKGKLDENKINELVETRIRAKIAPLERENNRLKTENEESKNLVKEYTTKERKRTIHDNIREAATKAKIKDTALDDALLYGENVFDVDEDGRVVTKDGVGITPGLAPEVWLTEIKPKRPHWWPESEGAGARSGSTFSGGSNPFSADNWNITEQGRILRENRNKAEQLAKSAGTSIGGGKPVKK